MKKHNNYIMASFLLYILLLLGGCVSSLQKPTGLESVDKQKEEVQLEDQSEEIPVEQGTDMKELTPSENKTEDEKERSVEKEKQMLAKQNVPKEKEKAPESIVVEDKKKTVKSTSDKEANSAVKQPKSPVTEAPSSEPPTEESKTQLEKNEEKPEPISNEITISIVISNEEVPLLPTTMEIDDGDTVLKALINITKQNKIQLDYRGGQGATAYIEGIANVYEFDRGQGSGWMYRVNGIFPDRGAGAVKLQSGDQVEWLYTTNLGEDLNASLKPFRR
ncbi:DUF4430 domain-containing protein [Sporosarcina sp. FSL W8-0480]|uniref:DUF4430 domain-containing protein n=1 Tax=Sporosarcina sp. FSL W8-0480 TaxID=2954701 RepID=UPI0030DBB3EF